MFSACSTSVTSSTFSWRSFTFVWLTKSCKFILTDQEGVPEWVILSVCLSARLALASGSIEWPCTCQILYAFSCFLPKSIICWKLCELHWVFSYWKYSSTIPSAHWCSISSKGGIGRTHMVLALSIVAVCHTILYLCYRVCHAFLLCSGAAGKTSVLLPCRMLVHLFGKGLQPAHGGKIHFPARRI